MLAVGGVGVDNIATYRGCRCIRATASARRSTNRAVRRRRSDRSPARWLLPQRLDFPAILPHIGSNEIRPLVRQLSRGRFIAFGASQGPNSMTKQNRGTHIRLTSHPGSRGGVASRFPIQWGAATARERGPVVGTVNAGVDRNAIGAHGGSYALYRALAVSSGALSPIARPDLTNTSPVIEIGPFPQWSEGRPHRVARSVGPSRRGGFPPGDRRGRRYPSEHRHHQGAAHDVRAERGRGRRAASRSTARS